MTTAIAIAETRDLMTMASTLAKSALIPSALRGKPEDVFVILQTGAELGLSPMQALRGIHVIEGKASLGADLIVGQCVKRKDVCEYFTLLSSTDALATYETKRVGAPSATKLSFSIEQARNAGLLSKGNWSKYPAAMLRARCATAIARAVYPDLAMGLYEPSEAEEIAGNAPRESNHPIEAEVVEATQKKDGDYVLKAIADTQTVEQLTALYGCIEKHQQEQFRAVFSTRKRQLTTRGAGALQDALIRTQGQEDAA